MMPDDILPMIRTLDLRAHPEGGYYRETFRSSATIETSRGPRAASTSIWYLLSPGDFSAWHRVAADEVWHHYAGDPINLHTLEDGAVRVQLLGPLSGGGIPQIVIPAGVWQAASPAGQRSALCGCTVAPGFDFEDFELGTRAQLLALFPGASEAIAALTRR